MLKSLHYTERTKAPLKHRRIVMYLSRGDSDKDVAFLCDCSIELVRAVKEYDPNADYLRQCEMAMKADNDELFLKHNDIVRGSLDLQQATLNAAMEENEDGEKVLKMQTKKDGTVVPVVPATLLKSLMVDPLDHDPAARFTKKIDVTTNNRDKGFGGGFLQEFKQKAIAEGFTPPQIIDAEFSVSRDGGAVLESSVREQVEISVPSEGVDT